MSNTQDSQIELLETTAIATAIAFFSGWEYARAYYQVFRIKPGLLEVQVPTYFVWAYRPLMEYWYYAAAAIVLVTVLNHIRRTLDGWKQYAVNTTILLILLFIFPLASYLSREVGHRDGIVNIQSPEEYFPLVSVRLKDPESSDRNALRDGIGVVHGGDYFLFGLHRGMYYLLKINSAPSEGPMLIPEEAISSIIIKR